MQITLNGKANREVEAITLSELVRQLVDRDSGIAVALNGEVAPRSSWPSTVLADGDRVDVLTAVQGG